MCVLRYNQSKKIKLGSIKNKNEFIQRDWKGISTKGFDDLKNGSEERRVGKEC